MLGYVDLGDIKKALAVRPAWFTCNQLVELSLCIFRQVYLDNRASMSALATPFHRLSVLLSGLKNYLMGQTLEAAHINAMCAVQIHLSAIVGLSANLLPYYVVPDTTSRTVSFRHSLVMR